MGPLYSGLIVISLSIMGSASMKSRSYLDKINSNLQSIKQVLAQDATARELYRIRIDGLEVKIKEQKPVQAEMPEVRK